MRSRSAWLALVGVAVLLFVTCALVPSLDSFAPRSLGLPRNELREGRVATVLERRTVGTLGGEVLVEHFAVQLDDGARVEVGRSVQLSAGSAPGVPPALSHEPGDKVLVLASDGPSGLTYSIHDRVRRTPVLQLAVLFSLLVVAVGGWRGTTALIGLGATILVVGRFIVPGILAGRDPLLVCIVGALVIMTATLTLGHGPNRRTAIALGATTVALLLGGVFSAWAVDLARLTGLTEDSATLQLLAGSLDLRGLLLGGIILGAVGVLDDVTTTQTATVFELREANAELGAAELFARAMNVGREHIAATTNTLLLAYAGTSLPLLVLLTAQHQPVGVLLSFDTLATEVVRTLAGSTAIVAAVPLTTALAAFDAARTRVETGEGLG